MDYVLHANICRGLICLSNACVSYADEPTKPGTPEIVDYDNESVTLSWTAPDFDGGAPIEKYVLEKKDR